MNNRFLTLFLLLQEMVSSRQKEEPDQVRETTNIWWDWKACFYGNSWYQTCKYE